MLHVRHTWLRFPFSGVYYTPSGEDTGTRALMVGVFGMPAIGVVDVVLARSTGRSTAGGAVRLVGSWLVGTFVFMVTFISIYIYG